MHCSDCWHSECCSVLQLCLCCSHHAPVTGRAPRQRLGHWSLGRISCSAWFTQTIAKDDQAARVHRSAPSPIRNMSRIGQRVRQNWPSPSGRRLTCLISIWALFEAWLVRQVARHSGARWAHRRQQGYVLRSRQLRLTVVGGACGRGRA